MRTEYIYKLQGNGTDSWIVNEYNENDELVNRYMVYEDPTIQVGPALKAVQSASPAELIEIKKILGI
jgi:hypothetical protein